MPRYRARTWIRGHAPERLIGLFPKGTRDCGDHEWYRADDTTDRCYHCTAGLRPPGSDLTNAEGVTRGGVSQL